MLVSVPHPGGKAALATKSVARIKPRLHGLVMTNSPIHTATINGTSCEARRLVRHLFAARNPGSVVGHEGFVVVRRLLDPVSRGFAGVDSGGRRDDVETRQDTGSH